MASLVLSGDSSGSITVSAPSVAGSTTQTLVNVTGTLAPIVSGTAVTCAGQTSIDFTGIPSWVKRITVMFQGVSLSGTSNFLIQAGVGSTPATTGYNSSAVSVSVSVASTTSGSGSNTTNGFTAAGWASTAASTASGQFVLTNISGNIWVGSGVIYAIGNLRIATFAGDLSLGGTLGMIRVTTVNGTDTFDTTPSAGTINIIYE